MEHVHIDTILDVLKQDIHIELIKWELTPNKVEEIFNTIRKAIKDKDINS